MRYHFQRVTRVPFLPARFPLALLTLAAWLLLQPIAARRLATVAAVFGYLVFKRLDALGLLGDDLTQFEDHCPQVFSA